MLTAFSQSAQARSITVTITTEVKAPGADNYEFFWESQGVEFDLSYSNCEFDSRIPGKPLACNLISVGGDNLRDAQSILQINKTNFNGIAFVTSSNKELSKSQRNRFRKNIIADETHRFPIEINLNTFKAGKPWTRTFSNKYGDNGRSRITVTRHE